MAEPDVNQYPQCPPNPIMLVVNFWELRSNQMGPKLDELKRRGIVLFTTFVPWQLAESDITHTLSRFLQCVATRKMRVNLILSPEVGVHYPNSGLPKDLLNRSENFALDSAQGKFPVLLPPNAFYLPSLLSPDFSKRFTNFMRRMENFFYDLAKTQATLLSGVRVILTGSYFKYYRSPKSSAIGPFEGTAGDYSNFGSLSYRAKVESHFSQREFTDPTPASANRWKTRLLEEVNRRWFYQATEDAFRARSRSLIDRRKLRVEVDELEVFTPEADPSMVLSGILQLLSDGHTDFARLSRLIEELSLRSASSCGVPACSYFHWTAMGGFKMMAEAEKQFLILKSLLLVGGQKGGVILDESEWSSFSHQFRSRVEVLARSLVEGDYVLRTRAFYLTPHLWSSQGGIFKELEKGLNCGLRLVSGLEPVLRESCTQLLVVDPSMIITRELLQKLMSWAKSGRVLVLSRSPLFSESARAELEEMIGKSKRIEVDLGFHYTVHGLGDGKMVIYDAPDQANQRGEPLSGIRTFVSSILALSEIESFVRLSDGRLFAIPLERRGEGLAVFIFNSTRRQVNADVIFPTEVTIADLGAVLSGAQNGSDSQPSHRFTLDVPPLGILPLSVEGISLAELRERQIAAHSAVETLESAKWAAINELSGYGDEAGELWI